MPTDYPDYTLPIVVIGTVTVTGAVTVSGTVAISGTVTVTGAVTVTGSVTVSGTVAVSGTVTVTGAVTVTGTVAISGSVAVTGTVAISGTVTVTGTVAISGTVTVSGAVTVSGTVAVSGTVTVSGTVAVSGTVTVTGSVTVSGTVAVSGTVTVTGSVTVSGTVAVSGTVTVTGTVAVSGTVTVSGAVTVSGTVAISGSVAVTGSVTVSGTVGISGSVTVTGAVTISGPVTVATVAADNIVIDKLTVGAYTENQRTIQNYYGATTAVNGLTTDKRAKFFPRGMRGQLINVIIRAQNNDNVPHNLYVHVAPTIGAGDVISGTIAVSTYGTALDATLTIRKFWNYDSMFIWVTSDNDALMYIFGEASTPYDHYNSVDTITWTELAFRLSIKVSMSGQTCGDVPVSGTVNNIEIPNASTARKQQSLNCPKLTEVLDTIQYGSGRLLMAMFFASSAVSATMVPRIYADGVSALPIDSGMYYWQRQYLDVSTTGMSIGKWDSTLNLYCVVVTLRIPFKRSLQIGFYNPDNVDAHTAEVSYSYEKIS